MGGSGTLLRRGVAGMDSGSSDQSSKAIIVKEAQVGYPYEGRCGNRMTAAKSNCCG